MLVGPVVLGRGYRKDTIKSYPGFAAVPQYLPHTIAHKQFQAAA